MRGVRVALAVVVVAVLLPAGASGGSALATPDLIERDVAAGAISRVEADTHLWSAFADPASVPARYHSTAPWHGTTVLLGLRERLAAMPVGPDRVHLQSISAGLGTGQCGGLGTSSIPHVGVIQTQHFRIEHAPGTTLAAGLTIEQYAAALEESWTTLIDDFGWVAPPLEAGGRYLVRVDPAMIPGLYGFVAARSNVGDNPNSAWNDRDAHTSCMALNGNFNQILYPSSPLASLRSTVAHEFLHSLQFGIGALHGPNRPDSSWVEGAASWVEDEVFDDADDNHFWLWPNIGNSMGAYSGTPYYYWIVWRGITERFGTGTAGGGQTIMRDFFERTSRESGDNLTAMEQAVAVRGISLAQAYHDVAIALSHLRACDDDNVTPYCFEEADGYVAGSGGASVPMEHASIGETISLGVRTDYATGTVVLPTEAPFDLELSNSDEATFRATVVCDPGVAGLSLSPTMVVIQGGVAAMSAYDPAGCERVTLVVTNELVRSANPGSSPIRDLEVGVSAV